MPSDPSVQPDDSISDLDLAVNKYKFPVGVEWQGVFYENEDEDNEYERARAVESERATAAMDFNF